SGRATLQQCSVGRDLLAGDGESVIVEEAERRQVRGREGSVGHVEVFRMGECRNFHLREASTSLRRPPHRPRISLALHPHPRRASYRCSTVVTRASSAVASHSFQESSSAAAMSVTNVSSSSIAIVGEESIALAV